MTAAETLKDMMTRYRPMAVLSNNIWQKGVGVWTDVGNFKARVILHGKELNCGSGQFQDLDGYSPDSVRLEIMRRNILMLPKSKLQKKKGGPWAELSRRHNDRTYRIINRNGRPHAVPHTDPFTIEEPKPIQEPPRADAIGGR